MKTAVVTGANGFIGSNLCNYLSQLQIHTYGIVRKMKPNMTIRENDFLHIIEMDLSKDFFSKQFPLSSIDTFYQLAWDGSSGKALADYEQQIQNITLSARMFELAKQLHAKKFIFTSTINEYEILGLKEGDLSKVRPSNIYAVSKIASDSICKILSTQSEVSYTKAILSNIFGPGDYSNKIHNTFIRCMLQGTSPLLTKGEGLYDWLYIQDAVKMLAAVGEHSIKGKEYYIGNRKPRKFKEFLIDVRDYLNPSLKLEFGGRQDDLDVEYSLINTNALYEDTGIRVESDFQECVKKTATWVEKRIQMGK